MAGEIFLLYQLSDPSLQEQGDLVLVTVMRSNVGLCSVPSISLKLTPAELPK